MLSLHSSESSIKSSPLSYSMSTKSSISFIFANFAIIQISFIITFPLSSLIYILLYLCSLCYSPLSSYLINPLKSLLSLLFFARRLRWLCVITLLFFDLENTVKWLQITGILKWWIWNYYKTTVSWIRNNFKMTDWY